MTKKLSPVHPGEILKEEFLIPFGLSQYRLAKELHLSEYCVSKIINGKSSVTADTALRLAAFFSTSADFWINLQRQYDLEKAAENLEQKHIRIMPFKPAVANL